jgi:hypothetical protein
MTALDIISLVLLILVLGSLAYLLYRMDVSAKNKHKMTAYNLLDEKNPDPKKIKNSIKMLRLYGGRWRKDPESMELIRLLTNLLDKIEKTGVTPVK